MVIKGTVKKLVSDEDIDSKNGKKYIKRVFVLEYDEKGDGKYVSETAFDVFGTANNRCPDIRVGDYVTITFSLKSREWKGKYFTQASVIFYEINKMNPGGDFYPSGGQRNELFKANGEANVPNGAHNDTAYYDSIAQQNGFQTGEEYRKHLEKIEEDDLPF